MNEGTHGTMAIKEDHLENVIEVDQEAVLEIGTDQDIDHEKGHDNDQEKDQERDGKIFPLNQM